MEIEKKQNGQQTKVFWEDRDIFLDVLRVVASMGVIGIHILMDYRMTADGRANGGVVLAESLIRWPVPCFLMLSGYFLFQKDLPLKRVIGKIIKRLAIPSALTALFITIFGAWVLGCSGFLQCISNLTMDSFYHYVGMLLNWELPEPGFWLGYMTTLMKMYLLYPILKFICRDSRGANESRWFLMALTFAGQMLVPVLGVECYIYVPIDSYALLYFLLGYEGYRWKQKKRLNEKWVIPACLSGYAVSGIITWIASLYLDIGKNNTFTESFFGYTSLNIAAEALFVFICFLALSECSAWKVPSKVKNLISWLSGRTLVIYLVHYLVILKIQTKGYDTKLSGIFGEGALFFLLYLSAVFVISLVIAALCERIAHLGSMYSLAFKKPDVYSKI